MLYFRQLPAEFENFDFMCVLEVRSLGVADSTCI